MIYLELLIGFLQVGLFSFGGAYAAIPLIREVVLSRGWLTDEAVTYMIAISESTPGPIMVNMATYIGSSQAGLPGAVIATTAVVLPAFFIILLITVALKSALKNSWIRALLAGLTPCITGIILFTGGEMVLSNLTGLRELLLTALLAVIFFGSRLVKKKISPIALILIAACLGLGFYGI